MLRNEKAWRKTQKTFDPTIHPNMTTNENDLPDEWVDLYTPKQPIYRDIEDLQVPIEDEELWLEKKIRAEKQGVPYEELDESTDDLFTDYHRKKLKELEEKIKLGKTSVF